MVWGEKLTDIFFFNFILCAWVFCWHTCVCVPHACPQSPAECQILELEAETTARLPCRWGESNLGRLEERPELWMLSQLSTPLFISLTVKQNKTKTQTYFSVCATCDRCHGRRKTMLEPLDLDPREVLGTKFWPSARPRRAPNHGASSPAPRRFKFDF